MANDQRTNFTLTRSEAARRAGLDRLTLDGKTDRLELCEHLGECIEPRLVQRNSHIGTLPLLRLLCRA